MKIIWEDAEHERRVTADACGIYAHIRREDGSWSIDESEVRNIDYEIYEACILALYAQAHPDMSPGKTEGST